MANPAQTLYRQASALLLYQSVFDETIGELFLTLLLQLSQSSAYTAPTQAPAIASLRTYGYWFNALASRGQNWSDYLIERVLQDENPFSQGVQKTDLEHLPTALIAAAKSDLDYLQNLHAVTPQQLSEWVEPANLTEMRSPIPWQGLTERPTLLTQVLHWPNALGKLAAHYRQQGTGLMARYPALRWQQGDLQGIAHPDPIVLAEIVGYDKAKQALIHNTECLLASYPALHVLLYGARGSGKSSLVKALVNQYATQGLRLIEVNPEGLHELPDLMDRLRDLPQKFIIFVDDLSFEEDNEAFKALKVVLEGRVTARATNTVVYATSNRRHLVREYFSDRPRPHDADEIQAWDTVQEKLSFSDRFGLTLTFAPADQATYLEIVHHLAQLAGLDFPSADLEFRAKQWVKQQNSRSGRTARQFVNYLQGELAMGS